MTGPMNILDHTACELGEGAFWHPGRQEFFWFDIIGRRLYAHDGNRVTARDLPRLFSAMGWIGGDEVLLSGEEGLCRYDLANGALTPLAAIEADRADTRSNDGRADPWGGFWASAMGRKAEAGAGSIYRYYRGELRRLHGGLTIPNAICFDGARDLAYFADTASKRIFRQPLDAATGWPSGAAELFLDLTDAGLNPDGAVTDAEGNLWNATWGAGLVICYSPEGKRLRSVAVPARQSSCPAFGGPGLTTLYVTSAYENMDEKARAEDAHAGKTFHLDIGIPGLPAPRFIP